MHTTTHFVIVKRGFWTDRGQEEGAAPTGAAPKKRLARPRSVRRRLPAPFYMNALVAMYHLPSTFFISMEEAPSAALTSSVVVFPAVSVMVKKENDRHRQG